MTFDRTIVINLDRRPERLREFLRDLPADWPFAKPQRVRGIDGQRCPPPSSSSLSPGAWGATRVHVRVLEDALNDGLQSLLILEDDAVFVPGFASLAKQFLAAVPDDWQMLYFGGEHRNPPRALSDDVLFCTGVLRAHAYAIRQPAIISLYQFLSAAPHAAPRDYIDEHLADFHATCPHVYAPRHWLVGQRANVSDVAPANLNQQTRPVRFVA